MGSQATTNVNIDTGDIATAVTNTEWDAAFTHVSNDGSDHSFVDQSVVIAGSPTFVTVDLTGVTDGAIPYMSGAGFATGQVTTNGNAASPDIRVTGTAQATMTLKDTGAGADVKFGRFISDGGFFKVQRVNDIESVTDDRLSIDLSSGDSVLSGTLTADGLTLGQDENITLGAQTLDHDGTDFVFNDSVNIGANALTTSVNIKSEPKHWLIPIINPLAAQTETAVIPIWPVTPAALTVTKIVVTLNASGNEVTGDLKYADARIGLANPVVINDFDTTSGVRTDDTITSAAVAAGKFVYLQFDAAPDTAITDMTVDVTWSYD